MNEAGPNPVTLLRGSLELSGRLVLHIAGESMAPLLRPGDRVVVVPCEPAELRPGDIVCLEPQPTAPTPVIHRFLFTGPEGLVVRGDNVVSCDLPWSPDQIMGRVVERFRDDGVTLLDRGWPACRGRWMAFRRRLRHRLGRRLSLTLFFPPGISRRVSPGARAGSRARDSR